MGCVLALVDAEVFCDDDRKKSQTTTTSASKATIRMIKIARSPYVSTRIPSIYMVQRSPHKIITPFFLVPGQPNGLASQSGLSPFCG